MEDSIPKEGAVSIEPVFSARLSVPMDGTYMGCTHRGEPFPVTQVTYEAWQHHGKPVQQCTVIHGAVGEYMKNFTYFEWQRPPAWIPGPPAEWVALVESQAEAVQA